MRALLARSRVLLALPGTALAADPVFEKYKVPTVAGAEINVEVMRPADNPDAPVILTYSPYNTLSETNRRTGERRPRAALRPKGYARAVADVLGTRNSSGCWDYGGANEQQSAWTWSTSSPHSRGPTAVGMIGGS